MNNNSSLTTQYSQGNLQQFDHSTFRVIGEKTKNVWHIEMVMFCNKSLIQIETTLGDQLDRFRLHLDVLNEICHSLSVNLHKVQEYRKLTDSLPQGYSVEDVKKYVDTIYQNCKEIEKSSIQCNLQFRKLSAQSVDIFEASSLEFSDQWKKFCLNILTTNLVDHFYKAESPKGSTSRQKSQSIFKTKNYKKLNPSIGQKSFFEAERLNRTYRMRTER